MNILSKIGEIFMAIKDLIQPRRGMYYVVISHKLNLNKTHKESKIQEKSILQMVRPDLGVKKKKKEEHN